MTPLSGIVADSLIVSAAGGVLSLDRTAAFQTMISRPLATAPLIGWILGNMEAAIPVGMALEVVFIGDPPVGSHIPAHETAIAVVCASTTVAALRAMPAASAFSAMAVLPLALVAALPLNRLYQKADSITRGFNARLFQSAYAGAQAGTCMPVRANLKGLAVFFIAMFIVLQATVLPMMLLADAVFSRVALPASSYPAFAGCVIVAAAGALNTVRSGKSFPLFFLSAAAAAAWFLWV